MRHQDIPWALVTGASSGLGIAFATALAARHVNLVLTARRAEPMRQLAADLEARHGVSVVVEPMDLAAPDGASTLRDRLDARGIEPDILVNNAAFGLSGAFVDNDPEALRKMLQLDIVALTELAHIFGQRMVKRDGGRILLVASVAAHQPTPLAAAYGAAKAYVLSLGQALHDELAPEVVVSVLSPGLMETGFFEAAGYQPPASLRRTMLTPAAVAAIGLDALFAGRPSVVAGRLNRLILASNRFTSRHFQAKVTHSISKG